MSDDWMPRYQPRSRESGSSEVDQRDAEMREQEERLRSQAAAIRHTILVLSGKGGVGKSTVAANLAWTLAMDDQRVGLLDADINGPTVPLFMGLQDQIGSGAPGFTPVPVMGQLKVMSIAFFLDSPDTPTIWRGPLKGGIIRQFIADVDWGELDYLIVDLPPGTGDEPLTVAQALPDADGGVVVTTPQEASLAVCRKAVNFLRAVKLPCLGIVENMSGFVCPHCGQETPIFSRGGGEAMAAQMGAPFLGRIPLCPEAVMLGDQGRAFLGSDAPEALAQAMQDITRRLVDSVED